MKQYEQRHVGMVHYSAYWRTYSLILDVTQERWVTELDSFGPINSGCAPKVRHHISAMDHGDRMYTVAEYYALMWPEGMPAE